ncbi:hypothetical protein [Paraglaciecola sp. L3A3]|uniref:hypothetical protein n=1 Tax=Paraglaciecola sp. L3A3 TaxID=2686358 RepID=UPI00131CA564|nr:hypothetical protein [Paraglaciecola sp. L3A3]
MFSFFDKHPKPVPTTVHPLVGAELVAISNYPNSPSPQSSQTLCRKVKVEGGSTGRLVTANSIIDTKQTGFIFDTTEGTQAFINHPSEFRFDLWPVNKGKLITAKTPLTTHGLNASAENWLNYSVVDLACLTSEQLLVAVSYLAPRPKLGLYVYSISTGEFKLLTEAEANSHDLDKYFEQRMLQPGQSLVLYYSTTQRQSAEIYHNNYNHILLFNEQYPDGLELLKLGIDNGNITKWRVLDNTLFLHTLDNRNPKNPVVKNWSLDISQLLVD